MNLLFQPFTSDILTIKSPEKFTYPFNYTPHELSKISAEELQKYLVTQKEWVHDFGLHSNASNSGVGKMFGVLVCKDNQDNLGQLWAFSGKLANGNNWQKFVPTVFDMLTQEGFYKKGEAVLNTYNHQIKSIEQNPSYLSLLDQQQELIKEFDYQVVSQKRKIKELKKIRQIKRKEASLKLSAAELLIHNNQLNEESKKENIILKKMNKKWQAIIKDHSDKINVYKTQIDQLKQLRKQRSADLQQQLFKQYTFLNIQGKTKSIGEIFDNNPPAGAGECCAPKLLHYAFKNKLTPICMAEFWWGKSPKSEIRTHKNFYPSCRSKCEPILLSHMLNGLPVDQNPLEKEVTTTKEIQVIYDDPWIAIVNKPSGLLSVPGKRIKNSVYTQLQSRYPETSGPLLVHRLDRATSGLLIVAKSLPIYINLQKQFTNRQVKKKYIALLDGVVTKPTGEINLPLRVDLNNRPQQLVCFEHGKIAKTTYKVVEVKNEQTLIHFFPVTGRTHQLRVHSAHILGLNTPIIGDDLYGKTSKRLYLHAAFLEFTHPKTQEIVQFKLDSDFPKL